MKCSEKPGQSQSTNKHDFGSLQKVNWEAYKNKISSVILGRATKVEVEKKYLSWHKEELNVLISSFYPFVNLWQ